MIADQLEDIQQQNMSIVGEYTLPLGSNEAQVIFGYNLFREDLFTTEREADRWRSMLELASDREHRYAWIRTGSRRSSYTANLGSIGLRQDQVSMAVFSTRDFEQIDPR